MSRPPTAIAYSSAEAARELRVSPATIKRWIDEGVLVETEVIRSSGRYVTAASVLALKAAREAEREAREGEAA